jgi:ABC-type uncharacterized transport system fused permease/ATPase subunit
MLLGEVTQAAAFAAVQGAFDWLIDNYTRLAEWASSARQLGIFLLNLDRLETRAERSADIVDSLATERSGRQQPTGMLSCRWDATGRWTRLQQRRRPLSRPPI